MSNPDLIGIVRQYKTAGKSEEEIRSELSATYPAEEITAALTALQYMRPDKVGVAVALPRGFRKQPPRNEPQSMWYKFRGVFIGFSLGFVFIFIIAFVFGILFNQGLVSQSSNYMGGLADHINLIIFMPIAIVIFTVIAFAIYDYSFIAYPPLAFIVSGAIINTEPVKFVADYIPADYSNTSTASTQYASAVILSYLLVYLLLKPIYSLMMTGYDQGSVSDALGSSLIAAIISTPIPSLRSQKPREKIHDQLWWLPWAAVLVMSLATILAFCVAAPSLHARLLKSREAVSVPQTDKLSSNFVSSTQYEITYKNQVSQPFKRSDEVHISSLYKWWDKKLRNECGDALPNSSYPGQVPRNQYKQTSSGVKYAEAVYTGNGTQPPTPDRAYKMYQECFIVGNHRYILEREIDDNNTQSLAKYPTEDVINAIAAAKPAS